MQDTEGDMEILYYVINEDEDAVVMRTTDRREALDKAGEIWDNGDVGTVTKNPV